MFAKITCKPPLGQPTVVSRHAEFITFHVLLETERSSQTSFEVALWCNSACEHEWTEHYFCETKGQADILQLRTRQEYTRRFYSLDLPRPTDGREHIRFTIKFRSEPFSSWKWAGEAFSVSDGILSFLPEHPIGTDLSDYIGGIDAQLNIRKLAAETPDTALWTVEANVEAAAGQNSGFSSRNLGIPKAFTRWFAIVRLWSPWVAPRHGRDKYEADKDAILCAFQREDGRHVVILPLSGVRNVLTIIKSDDHGNVVLHSKNDNPHDSVGQVLVAVSDSFDVANAAVMYQARRLVMTLCTPSVELEAGLKAFQESVVNPLWFEEWTDGFTYCTWNGLGQDLTEKKILDALDSLAKHGISITGLIIDDNWQSLDNYGKNQVYRGMTRFEANPKGFPNGMAAATTKIRAQHPSVKHIAVWHAMLGYWGAISPDGEIAKEYKTIQARNPGGGYWTCIDPSDIRRFYDDFYTFLSASGVDSVKTDAQFQLDDLQSAPDRASMINAFQDAWTLATLRHLGGRAISCMSQAPPLIFHSQLPTSKPHILVRNSDDFFPDIDSSHAWHVFCNAHNALFTQYLNALPDWDMFQTSHEWAAFHAAARCVSGGPIYFTDTPGQHNVELIRQMTATSPRGNTIILRPHRPGKSSQAYASYEQLSFLKIDTYVGGKGSGVSILGVFNVSQSDLTEFLTLNDFPGTEEGTYVVRSHVSDTVSKPVQSGNKGPVAVLDLGVKGYDIVSAYPLHKSNLGEGHELQIANLGLLGKMTGAAAIVDMSIEVEANGRARLWTSLKALGTLGVYISTLPKRSIESDFMGLLFGQPIPLECVQQSQGDKHILEIDVAKAWELSDQKAGWSNEVNVELFVR